MRHFISVDDLSNSSIMEVFEQAEAFQSKKCTIQQQLFAANLFFEPSTRTKTSFLVAERKLNLDILDFHPESSSLTKGETLYDTVKTFEAIGANIVVIRHRDDHWANEIVPHVGIPIINAGAGRLEHPTQSLLDVYTVYQEFGTCKDLNYVIAGDVKHSRVAHSSIKLLQRLGANVFVTGAKEHMDDVGQYPVISMDEAVEIADVLMLLRIQHERHDQTDTAIENYHEQYGLTIEREKRMKKQAIILHPAPVNRGIEIDTRLVECARSRIFKQMQNGVYIRMAIIAKLLQNWGIIDEYQVEKCAENHVR